MMRSELEKIIMEWMKADENVLFLTADIGGGLYKKLATWFPKRAINVGIAEQNMVGMAAGLTDMGYRVICYSKACFISLRVADQVKNALCYAKKNVLLVAADAGYDEANAGYPHISMEDLGIIRSFPEMEVYLPSTFHGMHMIFKVLRESDSPAYLRMNKRKIEENKLSIYDVGFALYYLHLSKSTRILIVSYGCSIVEAMGIAERNPDVSVLAMDSFSADTGILLREFCKYRRVIVLEEQFEGNGLYDYFCRLFVQYRVKNISLERIGPEFVYRKYCFDRAYALTEERVQHEKRYGRYESSEAANGTNEVVG